MRRRGSAPSSTSGRRPGRAGKSRACPRRSAPLYSRRSRGRPSGPALLQAVDDPAAVEIVRRELDPDAVAQEHADPVALHPPGGIAEHLVAVVEPDLEHPVAEGLDDLALHLDLLFLLGDDASSATRRAQRPPKKHLPYHSYEHVAKAQ